VGPRQESTAVGTGGRLGKRARFFKEEAVFTREALDLSAVDPAVLVLEDPQRLSAEDQRRLLAFVRGCSGAVKLIISTRPHLAEELQETLRQLGFPAAEVERLALPPLDDRTHEELVVSILGGRPSEEAHLIAQRTRGNVQAGVVTARLFRRGTLNIGQIEESAEFRQQVLTAFDAAVRQHSGGLERRLRDVLQVVAVAGPLRTDAEPAITAVAQFLDLPPHVLRSALADLEEARFLLRRGDLLRVPVDSVAEGLRRRACVSPQRTSLGYAEAALEQLWECWARTWSATWPRLGGTCGKRAFTSTSCRRCGPGCRRSTRRPRPRSASLSLSL